MKKRILAVLLTALMVFSAAGGSSDKGKSSGSKNLSKINF